MDARQVKTAVEARELVEKRGLSHVKVGFVDLDGVMRGKYMARNKFFASLESGVKFCDVVFGWDSNDQLYDASTFTGWHTAFPDATMRIDPTTCRNVSGEGDMLFFLGEFEDGAAALCNFIAVIVQALCNIPYRCNFRALELGAHRRASGSHR